MNLSKELWYQNQKIRLRRAAAGANNGTRPRAGFYIN